MGKILRCVTVVTGVCGGILTAAIIRDKVLTAIDSGRFDYEPDDPDCVDEDDENDDDEVVNHYKAHFPFSDIMKPHSSDSPITMTDVIKEIKSADGVIDENKKNQVITLMSAIALSDDTSAFFKDAKVMYITGVLDMTLMLPEEDRNMKNFLHILTLGATNEHVENGIINMLDKNCANGTYSYTNSYRKFKELTPDRTRFGMMSDVYGKITEVISVD